MSMVRWWLHVDEIVTYRITQGTACDSVAVDARKIVNAQEEAMGRDVRAIRSR